MATLTNNMLIEGPDLDSAIVACLERWGGSLTAKELVDELQAEGFETTKKSVNRRLYGVLAGRVRKCDETKRWEVGPPADSTTAPGVSESQLSQRWTEQESQVLVTIFFANDFGIGDDSRPECQRIAAELGRSAASVDRQWRNIAAVAAGRDISKVGQVIIDCVFWYQRDVQRASKVADHVCMRMDWNLKYLVHGVNMDV